MRLHTIAAAGAAAFLVVLTGGTASAAGVDEVGGWQTSSATPSASSSPAYVQPDYRIQKCLYHNGVKLGCIYADHANKWFLVCDSRQDGLYVKGRVKFGGHVHFTDEVNWPATARCFAYTSHQSDYPSGQHVGIRVGVEGIGWTPYKYGYA